MKIDSVAGAYLSCKPSFSPRGVVEASLSMPGLVPGVAERQSLVESGAANRFSGPQSVAVRLHGRMAKQAYSQRRTPEVSESRLEPCALDAAASSQLGSNFSPRQRHGSVQEARLEPGRDVAPRSYGSAVAVAACRGPRGAIARRAIQVVPPSFSPAVGVGAACLKEMDVLCYRRSLLSRRA